MSLKRVGHVALPSNRGHGGFDHADVHAGSNRLYVPHTSNDALDVIDCSRDRYVESVPGDPGVIDVIDTIRMRRVQTVETELGSHTFALDRRRGKLYAFLPNTHRAAVFLDQD
jgi:hypothetical protein